MSSVFTLGSKVRLVSFHGSLKSPEPIRQEENYWNLIEEEGIVHNCEARNHPAYPEKGSRVLVRFDRNLTELGLLNHNSETNCLWIFATDLRLAKIE